MRYCFIACDHGLGHIRRVASVCRELESRTNGPVVILGRRDQGEKFGRETVDFSTKTSRKALVDGDPAACRWHRRLPGLDEYDVVVSDNLPEVLELRSDAILMGSFLWHQVIDGIDADYRSNADRLLAVHKPVMIGSGLFASPELQSATRFVDVGLFRQADIRPGRGAALLVACGYTDECLDDTAAALRELARRGPGPYRRVYVEPRARPDDAPDWMEPADFTPRMFSTLRAAVVRPGMGTVTEALQAGARIFCYYEKDNKELKYNARQLERYGYGVDCRTAKNAVAAALEVQAGAGGSEREQNLPEMDGAARTAAWLASLTAPHTA